MLIYAAADIHGRWDRVQTILANVARHRPDVLVLAGDLCAWWRPHALQELVTSLSIPILAVGGNSDSPKRLSALNRFPMLRRIHLARETIAGVVFVGIDGTLPLPFHSRLGFQERRLETTASRLLPENGVLVVHPPPYGTRDRVLGKFHAGSRAVRRLIDRCAPGLVLCGHIHEQAGVASRGKTVVVNCALGRASQGAVIHYDGRSKPVYRMLT